MRKILLSFLIGSIVGGLIVGSLRLLEAPAKPEEEATAILDSVIDEWINRARPMVALAELGNRGELPDAQPRFFPDTVRSLARRIDSLYKIPKGIILAQWALESRWGKNALGVSNYFGHTYQAVKAYMPEPAFIMLRERIIVQGVLTAGTPVRFAKYRNMAECFETHGLYVSRSRLYRNAFGTASPEHFAKALAEHYATDPYYAMKLITIMKRYHL